MCKSAIRATVSGAQTAWMQYSLLLGLKAPTMIKKIKEMHVMIKKVICLTFIFTFIVLIPKKSIAAEYAIATPTFIAGKCAIVIWIHDPKGVSTRIFYPGDYSNDLCRVEIPVEQFEKNFSYCMLAGVRVNGSNNYLAQCGGGAGGGRENYWFEWRDPLKVFPTFNCVLKKGLSK